MPALAATQDGELELARLLLDAGSDVHLRTVEGWLALNVASMEARDLRQGKKLCERPCAHLKVRRRAGGQQSRLNGTFLGSAAAPTSSHPSPVPPSQPPLPPSLVLGARAARSGCI